MKTVYVGGLHTCLGEKQDMAELISQYGSDFERKVEAAGMQQLYAFNEDENMPQLMADMILNSESTIGREANYVSCALTTFSQNYLPGNTGETVFCLNRSTPIQFDEGGAGCGGFLHQIRKMYLEAATSDEPYTGVLVTGDNPHMNMSADNLDARATFSGGLASVVVSNVEEGMQYEMAKPYLFQNSSLIPALRVDPLLDEAHLTHNGEIYMDGRKVYKFVQQTVGPLIAQTVDQSNSYIIPHTASKKTISAALQKNNVDTERVYTGGIEQGNLGNASVFFGLEKNSDKQTVDLIPFGAPSIMGKISLKKLD